MFLQGGSRAIRSQWQVYKGITKAAALAAARNYPARRFHASRNLQVVKPVLLADIGEGIVECEIIQWFVEPGARIEEFSPLCEVQSDKASVEITSRFSGVVKKLYYDAGEMAGVGKPFVDIDIQGDASEEALKALTPSEPAEETSGSPTSPAERASEASPEKTAVDAGNNRGDQSERGRSAGLATPAVRHLSRELDVDISQIKGTGKDGRVLKEDIHRFMGGKKAAPTTPPLGGAYARLEAESGVQKETPMQLTNTQLQMFKTMTRSLTIPHFLYADEIDFTSITELRTRLNRVLARSANGGHVQRLSYLPFIIKAVSMALYEYPVLNARVDVDAAANGSGKPSLVLRSQHNIGVAMDTPGGLLVPVVKDVNARSVLSIAAELARLQALAQAGRLAPQDMSGGTITVSNIGSIGGTYLSPVIVEKEVAILGIGRIRTVPAFDEDEGEGSRIVKKHVCNFSWSADHRIIDGATLARAAGVVRRVVEEPDVMIMQLR